MEQYFLIHLLGKVNARPPISYHVKEYFEGFITEKVLKEKKILIGGRWQVMFTISFLAKGPKTNFDDIVVGKGARTVATESVKIYESIILIDAIKGAENPYLRTIELIFKALGLFLTSTYKKITPEFMDGLWNQVDLDYLLSLPYPAPFSEQKYLIDEIMKSK